MKPLHIAISQSLCTLCCVEKVLYEQTVVQSEQLSSSVTVLEVAEETDCMTGPDTWLNKGTSRHFSVPVCRFIPVMLIF